MNELDQLLAALANGPIEMNGQEMDTNVHYLARHAAEKPDAPTLTVGDTTLTRAELEAVSNQWAHVLLSHGVVLGDLVTIALPNGIEFIAATIATWKVGAVPQPVSNKLPAMERQAIVELADSRVVIGADAADHPGRVCLPVDFRPAADVSTESLPSVLSPISKAPTSGGSTGRPKLILSGSPAITIPAMFKHLLGMEPGDTQLVCGPLYHNAPFGQTLNGLIMGQHVIVQPRFNETDALDAIQKHKVTWLQVVPTMMLRMLRVMDENPDTTYDFSSVREMWHMAAPCPEWLKERWIEILGDRLIELYGGTETISVTKITGNEWLTHRGSVGRPTTGKMTILDEDGQPVPAGTVGEIYMRPDDGAPPTYTYRGAEAKRTVDGWETIGDLGWMDEEGFIYISDRRTDMIVAGGANIYPAEVEAAIDSHPAVLSCVVVGVPDDELGKRVHAIVQTSSPITEADLLAHLAERLVRYKIPRTIEWSETALRDDAGKVRRTAIGAAVADREADASA